MPFYGNITNKRNQFTYDKVYPNKTSLLNTVSAANVETITTNEIIIEKQDDGVFIGRYILIDYGSNELLNDNELSEHEKNYQIDNVNIDSGLQRSWDSTVWQKVYLDNQLTYVLIAELNAKQAQLELHNYPPHFRDDNGQKKHLSYHQVPGVENAFVVEAQDSYQIDLEVPIKNNQGFIQFPYEEDFDLTQLDLINSAGFNPDKRNFVEGAQAVAAILKTSSGQYYLTDQGYQPADDTLTFKIDLREFGNLASNFYDLLYSQNRDIVINIPNNITNINDYNIENALDNKLYRCGSAYYCVSINNDTNVKYWELIFDLTRTAEEDGSNSLFELMLNLKRLESIIENNSATISDTQMNIILSYFDSNNISETTQQLGEIMELKYLGYIEKTSTTPGYHQMQITASFTQTDGIMTGVVKFGNNFTFGDKIVLYKLPVKTDGDNPLTDDSGELNMYSVIMTNGTEATTGAWAKDTVGLVNFGLGEDKAYIYSAVPVWA